VAVVAGTSGRTKRVRIVGFSRKAVLEMLTAEQL
jgi:uncharacterized protein YggU (UPF0235/DUF167 family)